MKKTNWLVAGAFVVLSSVLGCGGASSKPAPESLPQGLSVFEASEDFGISGAFKKGEHVVFFETRRGAVRPDFHRTVSPELGEYEVDARYTDEKGNTLVLQKGGDTFADPTWESDLAKQELSKKVVVLPEQLELASEAADAITKYQFPSTLSFHRGQLADLGVTAKIPVIDNAAGTIAKDVTGYDNIQVGASASYEIHYKYIACVAWICAGQHSAVRVRTASGAIYDGCQHGSCAGSMGSISCRGSGSGGTFQRETSTNLTSYTSGCLTSYNWNSGGGTHNCHDDSMMAGYGIKYGMQSQTAGVCQGLNWWYAPGNSGHACP